LVVERVVVFAESYVELFCGVVEIFEDCFGVLFFDFVDYFVAVCVAEFYYVGFYLVARYFWLGVFDVNVWTPGFYEVGID